ncbi:MAG: SDR family oxidoreductase [Candidatus Bilamarchaeaceae archaeon]
MKILITGGAGFIGSHLAEALLKRGHAVRILDNFSTGKEENIKDIENSIEIIRGSITEKEVLENAIENVDYVLHHAAQISVVDSIKNPKKTWEINIKGTKLLLNAAVKNKVKKVILASSAAVYGNEPGLPKTEQMRTKPTSPYGDSKLMNEYMAQKYHQQDKINIISLRYFNVYGPRQHPQSAYAGVISKFMEKMIKGERPIIYGNGEQTRDFVYVEDVVSANILALESTVKNGIYNIGSGKETSLNELVKTLNEILGTKIEPIYEPPREGDIQRSVADISKAKKDLGYIPKYTLKEGLTKTIEWYRSIN